IRWVLGHLGIHRNEEVDKHTKLAVESRQHSSPPKKLPKYLHRSVLPLSILVLKEVHHKETQSCWECHWCKSPRYNCMHQINPKLMQHSFIKL
ncbi:uncharacterized protein BJ212DRAFT_1228673, partial [Suillus subaureus]